MYDNLNATHTTVNIFSYSEISNYCFKPKAGNTASWYNPAICVMFFKDAEATLECNAEKYHISGDSLIFIPAYCFVRITFFKEYKACYQFSLFSDCVCRKSAEHKKLLSRLISAAKSCPVISLGKKPGAELALLFSQAINDPEATSGEALNINMLRLSSACFENGTPVPMHRDEKNSTEITEITDYILRHLQLNLNLDIISDRFNYDKNYFCRRFKRDTNYTFSQFVAICRISSSVEYLYNGYPIENAGKLCGYKNVRAYVRAFKSIFGIEPKKFIHNVNNYAFSSHRFS